MKVAVLVASRNRPDLVEQLAGWLARHMTYDYDLVVVEAGTEPDQVSPHATLQCPDAATRGERLAQNFALEHARENGRLGLPYDYYFVLRNDAAFDEGVDVARILIETLEREPRLALLAPTSADERDPGAARRAGGGWRPVTTCDDACFMLRARVVDEVGFLSPDFRYGLGALHELSYHLYRAGWLVGTSDDVTCRPRGRSAWVAADLFGVGPEETERRAMRFAYAYFAKVYGPDWPARFWAAAARGGAQVDTFASHHRRWASAFDPEELMELAASRPLFVPTASTAQAADLTADLAATPMPARAPEPVNSGADSTADRHAVFAWPRYDCASELERFFHVFARALSGRDDAYLLLRVDAERDPARETVLAALAASHARILGEDAPLDVHLLEGELTPDDWRELDEQLLCRVRSSCDAPPRDVLQRLTAPVVADAASLYGALVSGGAVVAR